jgi:hypothetical protein
MADFDTRPTFRVKESGQLLVCKCRCESCTSTTEPAGHCGGCSIGRALHRIHRKRQAEADQMAAQMQESMNG